MVVIQPAKECATTHMPRFLRHIHLSELDKGYSDQSHHLNQAGQQKKLGISSHL